MAETRQHSSVRSERWGYLMNNFCVKIKSQKKKKKVYTAPSCGVYISATMKSRMKYHCPFLLSLSDFDSIHILSRRIHPAAAHHILPAYYSLAYPFCMDSNCYPCDLTKVKHKSSLRFFSHSLLYCLLIWMDAVHILRVDILVYISTWDCRL